MAATSIYTCKICNKVVAETDKTCACGADLSKGRNITITLGEALRLSDAQFSKTIDHIRWESNDLGLIGIFLALLVGLIPLLEMGLNNLIYSTIGSVFFTGVIMILITKVGIVRKPLIRLLRWFMK